jgi:thiosulfate/3-mercaptopyruvate sulfurtransferase
MKKILLVLFAWGIAAASYAKPAFLVDADWLAEHIDDEKLVVLEVRYHPHR